MTVSVSGKSSVVTGVSVAPTETTVLTLSRDTLRGAKRVTVQVINGSGTETISGIVYRRIADMSTLAASSLPDFSSIGPGLSAMADLDVEGSDEVQLRFTSTGAGSTVSYKWTRKAATP